MNTIVYGGAFNPFSGHHLEIVKGLRREYPDARLIVFPCGDGRIDKSSVSIVRPVDRATMIDLSLAEISGIEVDFSDLEKGQFTPNFGFAEKFPTDGILFHAVGTDVLGNIRKPLSEGGWFRGQKVWDLQHFIIIPRPGYPLPEQLPLHHVVASFEAGGSSSLIRDKLFHGESVTGLVAPAVESYMQRFGLYQGRAVPAYTQLIVDRPHALFVVDSLNPDANKLASSLSSWTSAEQPNIVVSVGGDGTMIHAVQKHWRKRLPYVGFNRGHRGFLLNKKLSTSECLEFFTEPRFAFQSPLLTTELSFPDGTREVRYAVNDVFARCLGTGWFELEVDGVVRHKRVEGDGILVASSVGSTAWARSMGAQPIPVGTPQLVVAGSNIAFPYDWKHFYWSLYDEIVIRSLDDTTPRKRPVMGVVDGMDCGEITQLSVRASRIAAAEFVYNSATAPIERYAEIVFGSPKR